MGLTDFLVNFSDFLKNKKMNEELLLLEIKAIEIEKLISEKLSENLSEGDHFGTWKNWKQIIDQIENKYKRLKERFKHDEKGNLEITKDYFEFIDSALVIIENGRFDGFYADDYHLAMQEIERRFDKLLKN